MAQTLESLEREGVVSARHANKVRAMHRSHSQPSKMTDWNNKSKTDARLPARGPKASNTRSINENQREGSPIASKPTRGGGVGGPKATPRSDAINQVQKPNWPRLGKGSKRLVPSKLRGTKTNSPGPYYGGGNNRGNGTSSKRAVGWKHGGP